MKGFIKLLLLTLIIGYYITAIIAADQNIIKPKFKEGDVICFDDEKSHKNKDTDMSCRKILKIKGERYYFKYKNIKRFDIVFNSNIIEFELYKKY